MYNSTATITASDYPRCNSITSVYEPSVYESIDELARKQSGYILERVSYLEEEVRDLKRIVEMLTEKAISANSESSYDKLKRMLFEEGSK